MGGKWVHRLTSADHQSRTGVCERCGPVEVVYYLTSGGQRKPRCRKGYQEQKDANIEREIKQRWAGIEIVVTTD